MKLFITLLLMLGIEAMSRSKKEYLKLAVKEMFYHAYESYMLHGFPDDELSPLRCVGRGRDHSNPSNIGINDVLGDFSLTLIDSLDMLFIIGDYDEFFRAISLVERHVDFTENTSTVQVFESNIRLLGGLLSAHLLASRYLPGNVEHTYNDVLLKKAVDLADRLMPAFNISGTGLPFPRVNLMHGVPKTEINQTCSAGAGTLILEFGVLSRLTGNPVYETAARTALQGLWSRRSRLDLVGNVIDIQSGTWIEPDSGIGAGIDSLFEYQFKAYILFGDADYLRDFQTAYRAIMKHVLHANGFIYQRVNMHTGGLVAKWIDSLGAFFPGLQVLYGDVTNAIKSWSIFDILWKRYNGLPERFDFTTNCVVLAHYPLRPEHIESTYMLYQATKSSIFLDAGERFIVDFQRYYRKTCGFASMADVTTKVNDDRMESFFLSETLKYLYLLFDEQNILNTLDGNLVFSTEAHPLILPKRNLDCSHMVPGLTCPRVAKLFSDDLVLWPILEEANSILNSDMKSPESDHAMCMKSDPYPFRFHVEFKPLLLVINGSEFPKFEIKLIDRGDFLINHVHNVNLGLLSSQNNGLRITQIEGMEVSEQSRVLCSQKYLKSVNNGQDFIVNQGLSTVRLFTEHSVYLDNSVLKTVLRRSDTSELFVDMPAQKSLFGYQPSLISVNDTKYPVEGVGFFDDANHLGCKNYNIELTGHVVIVRRGQCTFMEKALYAFRSGAVGLIIINDSDSLLEMASVDELLPYEYLLNRFYTVMVRHRDGELLLKQLNTNAEHRIALFRIHPRFDFTFLNDVADKSRTLLSVDERIIENLIVITETEYEMMSNPESLALYSYLDPPKSRVLYPGMHWDCLSTCKSCIRENAVCCS